MSTAARTSLGDWSLVRYPLNNPLIAGFVVLMLSFIQIIRATLMSKDFTAQVIYQPSTHQMGNPKHNAQRYQVGDVIAVEPIALHNTYDEGTGDWVRNNAINPKFLYINVTGVPNSIDPRRLTEEEVIANDSPILIEVQENPTIRRRMRKFHINPSLIPLAGKQKLLADGQITVTFAAFKSVVQRKVVNVTLDSSQDTNDLITDTDVQ